MGFHKYYAEEELREIEDILKDLSLQIIGILKKYKEEGLISESEYKTHTEVKENFLEYLNQREKLTY